MLQQKMLEKNFDIKQRIVNESKPFVSYHSQNLFKLPDEIQNRTKLIASSPNVQSERSNATNVAKMLLYESDSQTSECNPKEEKKLIEEWKENDEANKSETSSMWAERVKVDPEVAEKRRQKELELKV